MTTFSIKYVWPIIILVCINSLYNERVIVFLHSWRMNIDYYKKKNLKEVSKFYKIVFIRVWEVLVHLLYLSDKKSKKFLFNNLIHFLSKLPTWAQSFVPNIFYIEEKSRNFFPYTETEYSCSFLPKFSISVQTRYENNTGDTENVIIQTNKKK